jgi:hypothetical protein
VLGNSTTKIIYELGVSLIPFQYSHPPGQGQVPQDKEHEGCSDEFMRGLGRHLPVNYGCGGLLSLYDVII